MRDALSIDRAATARANREVHADWPAPPPAAFPRSPSSAIGVNRCLRSVIGADPGSSHCQPLPAIANIPFARASATITSRATLRCGTGSLRNNSKISRSS